MHGDEDSRCNAQLDLASRQAEAMQLLAAGNSVVQSQPGQLLLCETGHVSIPYKPLVKGEVTSP
jgi:hypothetical protein